MKPTIIVHNIEDAEQYLLLGFAVTMPAWIVKELSIKDHIIHAANLYDGPGYLMSAYLEPKPINPR